jgi:hypothetical protein
MGYILLVALLLTSSSALATEDSLRTHSPYEFFDLFEDLYDSPEQAEQAIDYFDVLTFSNDLRFDDLADLPGISSSTAFRVSKSDTLNWTRLSGSLTSKQTQLVSSLISRNSKYLWSSRSRLQVDPNARQEKGYNDGRIQGDQYKLYDRLMLSQYGLRVGLLQAKDAGEARTLDHVRGFLQLQERQSIIGDIAIENAIAGDYSLGFGSGLLFSGGGMQGKSSEVIDAVEAKSRGVQGYLSSSVASGFRGAATTLSIGSLRSTLFYSNRAYDASLDSSFIMSIDLDGYHRTSSEVAKIDAASSNMLGADVSYGIKSENYLLRFGTTGYNEIFSMPVNGGGFAHNFRGKALSMVSQYGSYVDTNFSINYEVAFSKQDNAEAIGSTIGFSYEPSKQLQFALNGRYLPHNFVSRHGSALGESTDDAQNERGVYFGVRYLPSTDLTLSSYVDFSSTFTPPYLAQNNFKTTDLLLLAEYEFSNEMKLTSRSRWKRKSDEERLEDSRVLGSRDQFNSRLENEWKPNDNLRLRTRGEIVRVAYSNFSDPSTETGFLLSSSMKAKLFEVIDPEVRVTWFKTPSYDSRLYVYENDIAGASGLTMLYGSGMRYSLVVGFDVIEGATMTAKYGITVYSKERDFGSGITERTGKTSSKLGVQLDLQF